MVLLIHQAAVFNCVLFLCCAILHTVMMLLYCYIMEAASLNSCFTVRAMPPAFLTS